MNCGDLHRANMNGRYLSGRMNNMTYVMGYIPREMNEILCPFETENR